MSRIALAAQRNARLAKAVGERCSGCGDYMTRHQRLAVTVDGCILHSGCAERLCQATPVPARSRGHARAADGSISKARATLNELRVREIVEDEQLRQRG